MGRTVYMSVTNDRYEFPLGVADSVEELSRLIGKNKDSIASALRKARAKGYKSCYLEIEIDDEGEQDE